MISVQANAQDTQTLISNDVSHGGYGTPAFGGTYVNGQPSYLRGTRGAWVINLKEEHTINIGLGQLSNPVGFQSDTLAKYGY